MQADHFFRMGSTHSICQDYAFSGSVNENPFAIVSDGCSSVDDTDIGARLLVRAAANHIHLDIPAKILFENILAQATQAQQALQLNADCLSATLLIARVVQNQIEILALGDGLIVVQEKEWAAGETKIYKIDYSMNAPFYPYLLNEGGEEHWKTQFPNNKKTITCTTLNPDKTVKSIESYESDEVFEQMFIPLNGHKLVTVFSDGIQSFQKKNEKGLQEKVPDIEALKQIFDFKSYKGVFLQRQANWFFKQCIKNNLTHYDDFSIAGISLE